jgi:WD40 repeat protein
LRTFPTGHSDVIRDIAYNRDGRILATGSYDGTVILWDSLGFPLGSPLKGHKGAVLGVAFSPDGKTIASGGEDGTVNLWNISHPREHKTLTVGDTPLGKIAFAPDSKTLACATEKGTVVLLDVEARARTVTLPGHQGGVFALAFSPDGKTLASGGEDHKIIFWNFPARKAAGSVEDSGEVFSLAFTPDGKMLASGNRALEVTFWDVMKRKRTGAPLQGHVNTVFGVAFTPDGKTLISASLDKTIRRWDVATRKLISPPLVGSGQAVYCVAVHPNGKTIASGAEGGVATVWDLKNASVIADSLGFHDASVAAVTTDGKTIAAADSVGNVTLFGPTVDETFKANLKEVKSLAFSPDGTVLASVGDDNIIQLRTWTGTTWNTPKRSLPTQPQPINRIAFNPTDNNILASAQGDGSTLLWNLASGQAAAGPVKLASEVTTLVWSRDGKKLAAGGNSEIALWNGVNSRQFESAKMHHNTVWGLAFSLDGKLLASAGEDDDVILWNAETCQFVQLLREHTARARDVAFSPDGKVLASCSEDKSIILWDVATGTSIYPLVTDDFPSNVFFLPNGNLLSSGGNVIDWGISMESLRDKAEQVAARNLTGQEWKYFMGARPYRQTSIYGSAREADMLALQNKVEEARTAFQRVVAMAAGTKSAGVNNQIGWYGCLDGFAEIVKSACDHAVELARPEDRASFQDSRALANALTGKFSEAAEDFKAFVLWSKKEEERLSKTGADSRTIALRQQRRKKREEWISELLSGHNPFDAETLKTLRIGESLLDE